MKYAYYIKKDNKLVDIKTDDFKNKDNVYSNGDEFVQFKGDKKKYYTLYGIIRTIIMFSFKADWNKKEEETRVTEFKFFCSLLSQEFRRYLYENIRWANESTNQKVIKRREAMKEILYPKDKRDKDAEEERENEKNAAEATKIYKEWWDFLSWGHESDNFWIRKKTKRTNKIKEMKKKINDWGEEYKWLNDYLIHLTYNGGTNLGDEKVTFKDAQEALNRYNSNSKIKQMETAATANTTSSKRLQLKF